MTKLITAIAGSLDAYLRCEAANPRNDWADKHEERIEQMCKEYLPSGSGFDSGTTLNFEKSKPDRLVFETSFHHMDDSGGYCGWTDHTVTVTPSLVHGFTFKITGRDRNDIKSLISDTFSDALDRDIPHTSREVEAVERARADAGFASKYPILGEVKARETERVIIGSVIDTLQEKEIVLCRHVGEAWGAGGYAPIDEREDRLVALLMGIDYAAYAEQKEQGAQDAIAELDAHRAAQGGMNPEPADAG